MPTDLDSSDPLLWLSSILWPDGATTIQPDRSTSTGWWASPSADQPKILIPAGSMAAARAAVARYHDGFSPARRLRSLAAEGLMANSKIAELALGRAKVAAVGTAPSIDSTTAGGGVPAAIRDLMGVEDLHIAVSLSVPKSNRKPVLQLLDGDGNCLGWAKVAWNERTDALVGNEAHWLSRSGHDGRPLAPLAMPRLLHDEVLAGRRVAITSGVSPSRFPRRSAAELPNLDVLWAVRSLGTEQTVAVADSAWWRSVEAAMVNADPRETRAITTAADAASELTFQVGAWHGDLTPWNLMTTSDGVQLIDWEFAADGVPFGFDLCHFHTQVAAEMKGCSAAEALDRSARLSPLGLADLGVEAENRLAVWRLYLVELIRRSLALRADGYPTDNVHQGPAALDRLERSFGIDGAQIVGQRPAAATGVTVR